MESNKLQVDEKEKNMIVYGVYVKLIDAIKHYSSIQLLIRSIVSTLFLGSFASIGYVYSIDTKVLPFRNEAGVLVLAFLALGVITALSVLDIIVQERMVIANMAEALKLEKTHSWIPKLFDQMLEKHTKYSFTRRLSYFYMGAGSSLIVSAGIAAESWTSFHGLVWHAICWAVAVALVSVYIYLFYKLSKKSELLVIKLTQGDQI